MAVTSDQIFTCVRPVIRYPADSGSPTFGSTYELVWYWKVVPVDPGTAFEGIRGYARFRGEAERLVDANVANVLANGVTGITTA